MSTSTFRQPIRAWDELKQNDGKRRFVVGQEKCGEFRVVSSWDTLGRAEVALANRIPWKFDSASPFIICTATMHVKDKGPRKGVSYSDFRPLSA